MILGLCIALGLTIVTFYILLDRKDKRWTDALDSLVTSHRLNVIALMDRQAKEREEHRLEVQIMCNRLQAPQQAVMQSIVEQAGPDETRPLTDAEAAEEKDRALAIERIEALEREGMRAGWLQ